MPDEEVARPAADGPGPEGGEVLFTGVCARRKAFQPVGQAAMESRDQRQRPLLGGRIGEIEDALGADGHG